MNTVSIITILSIVGSLVLKDMVRHWWTTVRGKSLEKRVEEIEVRQTKMSEGMNTLLLTTSAIKTDVQWLKQTSPAVCRVDGRGD